jgi:hypothetical protein
MSFVLSRFWRIIRPFVPSPLEGNAASEVDVETVAVNSPAVDWFCRMEPGANVFRKPPVVDVEGFWRDAVRLTVISFAIGATPIQGG